MEWLENREKVGNGIDSSGYCKIRENMNKDNGVWHVFGRGNRYNENDKGNGSEEENQKKKEMTWCGIKSDWCVWICRKETFGEK